MRCPSSPCRVLASSEPVTCKDSKCLLLRLVDLIASPPQAVSPPTREGQGETESRKCKTQVKTPKRHDPHLATTSCIWGFQALSRRQLGTSRAGHDA